MSKPNAVTRRYLSEIGQRGGKKSRRSLSPEEAREMVRIREAKRAYRKFHTQCFWSYDPDLEITRDDMQWVAKGLMCDGGHEGWELGIKLRG